LFANRIPSEGYYFALRVKVDDRKSVDESIFLQWTEIFVSKDGVVAAEKTREV